MSPSTEVRLAGQCAGTPDLRRIQGGGNLRWSIFRERPEAFDFILLDFNMPGMNGVQTYLAIQEWRPGFPAILCSSSDQQTSLQECGNPDLVFLAKPFRSQDLKIALDQVMGRLVVGAMNPHLCVGRGRPV